jgi:hypothetical protein
VNKGVNISHGGQISPLGAKFTPKSEGPAVKLRMALSMSLWKKTKKTSFRKYIGRCEMWRMKKKLTGSCVFLNKKVEISQGSVRCQVHEMWGQVTKKSCPETKSHAQKQKVMPRNKKSCPETKSHAQKQKSHAQKQKSHAQKQKSHAQKQKSHAQKQKVMPRNKKSHAHKRCPPISNPFFCEKWSNLPNPT